MGGAQANSCEATGLLSSLRQKLQKEKSNSIDKTGETSLRETIPLKKSAWKQEDWPTKWLMQPGPIPPSAEHKTKASKYKHKVNGRGSGQCREAVRRSSAQTVSFCVCLCVAHIF